VSRIPDSIRFALRDARLAQHRALPVWREELSRLVERDPLVAPAAAMSEDHEAVGLGWTRRSVLRIGGASVAMTAVLAACGVNNSGEAEEPNLPQTGQAPPTTGVGEWATDDSVLLRTSTSLEQLAIEVYQAALDNGWITTSALVAAATLFQEHHAEHKAVFAAATRGIGAEVFDARNPAVWSSVVVPAVTAIGEADEADRETMTLEFAHALEGVAASTYQSIVPAYSTPRLRLAAMSVGGVEARHQAVLAGVLPNTLAIAGVEALRPTTTVDEDAEPAATVYQVPGAFGPLTSAIGPASLVYPYTEAAE
jgi:hypothetical protein